VNPTRIVAFFGLWAVANLFFNGITNRGAIPIGFNLRLDRVVYALFLIEFFRQYGRSGLRKKIVPEEKLMMLLFVILLFSSLIGGSIFNPNNRYYTRLFGISIVPATFFMVARRTRFDLRSLKTLATFFLITTFYLGFTGVCEHFHLEGLVLQKDILDPGLGIHFGRVRGPFLQSVVMGGVLSTLCLCLLWFHFKIRRTLFTWVAFVPGLASVYFSYTRAVWFQLAASLAVLAIFVNPLRKPTRIVALAVAAVYFSGIASKFSAYQTTLFNRRHEQVDDRINIYHASWRMFLERPLFGFGYGNFLDYCEDYFEELPGVELRGQHEGQHNTILGLMCETGVVGAVPYCLMYLLFFRQCYRRFHSAGPADPGKFFALTQLAVLAGNVVSMQFSDFNCYAYFNNLTFWLAGMAYADFEPLPVKVAPGRLEYSGETLLREPAHA